MTTTKKLTKEAARKAARARLAGQQAEARRRAEEEAARREALRREVATLNEDAMADYFQHESAIDAAREELKRIEATSTVGMGTAILDIADREGSVSAAARLLGISVASAKRYVAAAEAPVLDKTDTDGLPVQVAMTPTEQAHLEAGADAAGVSDRDGESAALSA